MAVAASQCGVFLGEIEHLGPVAQDHVVGLLLRLEEGRQGGVTRHAAAESVEFAEQLAAVPLLLFGDTTGNDAFDIERLLQRVAAGDEWFVTCPQKARLGESPQRLGHHDIRWNQALVSGVVTSEQRDHGAGAGIDQPIAGRATGLHQVGRRFMAAVVVGHAADDGVLVGLLGQQRKLATDADAVHIGRDRFVQRTAVVVARVRLGIESVGVRRAAPHPHLDHGLGLGRRCLRGGPGSRRPTAGQQSRTARQTTAQHLAPRDMPAGCVLDRSGWLHVWWSNRSVVFWVHHRTILFVVVLRQG